MPLVKASSRNNYHYRNKAQSEEDNGIVNLKHCEVHILKTIESNHVSYGWLFIQAVAKRTNPWIYLT